MLIRGRVFLRFFKPSHHCRTGGTGATSAQGFGLFLARWLVNKRRPSEGEAMAILRALLCVWRCQIEESKDCAAFPVAEEVYMVTFHV